MSLVKPRRRSRVAAALGAGLVATALCATLLPTAAHAADLAGTITVTTPANAKIAAMTAKQVVVLTVSGAGAPSLSEDNVASVGLGPLPCDALTTYVVTSPTVITAKTPATCPAGIGDVVITFSNGNTLTKTNGITFVAPPAIAALADRPVINDNSTGLATADQRRRFSIGGGQVVRVKADAGFAFDPRSAAALAASMGGKAGTEVKVYADDDGTTPLTTTATGTDGNSMTFKTAAAMTAGENTVSITQNGVTKSFLVAATGIAVVSAPSITSLSVESGRAVGGNTTVITGANLPKVLGDAKDTDKWLVKFCNTEVPATAVTAVNTLGTAVTVTVPNLTNDADGLGLNTFAGACPVTVTDVVADQQSSISHGSTYTVLNE